jgi:hypothetical protein
VVLVSAFEPGTADITTTDDPPFPAEPPARQSTTIAAEYGWKIVLTSVGLSRVRAELVHPWLGTISTAVYEL